MTKTAEVADVLLPATSWGEHGGVFTCADRGFQRFGKAIEASGNVKRDWEIISLLATEMGYPMHYESNQQIWDEMRELCPLFYGVTYEKMGEMGHVQWPCPTLDHPVHRIYTKTISSTRLPVKASSLPPPGALRLRRRMKTIRWCSARCAKLGTTPAGQ
jgi:predicted molibdopterin-dependent oxidoreductase YjgC